MALTTQLRDYVRAVAGGLVVGLPLLYTMEVWFKGFTLAPVRIVVLLAVAFVVVVAFNLIAGFRRERTVIDVVADSVQSLGIAMVISAVTLALVGQLEGVAPAPIAGKIALESIPVAFGVSLARTQFPSGDGAKSSKGRTGRGGVAQFDQPGGGVVGPFGQLTLAAAGALIFALNVAPTDEIVMIAVSADSWLLIALVAASLVATLALVFWSNFPAGQTVDPESPLDGPYGETISAYAVSLGISLLLLWAFGRTDDAGWSSIVPMVVVLGFVGSIGGAIGRLFVGGGSERTRAEQSRRRSR